MASTSVEFDHVYSRFSETLAGTVSWFTTFLNKTTQKSLQPLQILTLDNAKSIFQCEREEYMNIQT